MDWFISKSTLLNSSFKPATAIGDSLKELTIRSTEKGIIRLVDHLLVIGISGYYWVDNWEHNWLAALPGLVIYGFSLAAMFAPLHECSHRTAFANKQLNDMIGWLAGLLSFYNSTYFRYYHQWHHLHTLDPAKNLAMSDQTRSNTGNYLLHVSGLTWWKDQLTTHIRIALGQLHHYPFIPVRARGAVVQSTRLQLAIYAIAILTSLVAQQPWFIWYWLLPLLIGQPIWRWILSAENHSVDNVRNSFTKTLNSLTLLPIRFLMWNMSFHAEHHLYPTIPFYQLPFAHQQLQPYFVYVD